MAKADVTDEYLRTGKRKLRAIIRRVDPPMLEDRTPKQLLLISYYWPPAGGGGVQRWLKMSRYLPESGWMPTVFTARPKYYVAEDPSLIPQIHPDIETIAQPIWEPYTWYKRLTGRKSDSGVYSAFIQEKKSRWQSLAIFLRGNLFIPDARRFWIRPSARFLSAYVRQHPVDAIVSTGPPHSTHLIAYRVKKRFPNIPWVADFRDPWTGIDFYDQLKLTRWADARHRSLEQKVLRTADRVVTVSWTLAEELSALANRHVDVITNGYDPKDFESDKPELSAQFSICHIGSMNRDRNVDTLWRVLADLKKADAGFARSLAIHLVGQTDVAIGEALKRHDLASNTTWRAFMEHDDAIDFMRRAQVLLLSINRTPNSHGILPGKLYEYLASERPILAIGPKDGDIAKLLSQTNGGELLDYEDADGLRQYILRLYKQYTLGRVYAPDSNYKAYARSALASAYSDLLNAITTRSTTAYPLK